LRSQWSHWIAAATSLNATAADACVEGAVPMTEWTTEELTKIGNAEELQLASIRRDDTLRKPVTVWVVRHGDRLYVRSVKGTTGAWFRGTQTRRRGRIQAGVVEKEVKFIFDTDEEVNAQIDAAYREKYRRYPDRIVNSVLTPAARSSTIELLPPSAT
jgi:hypothetical protein